MTVIPKGYKSKLSTRETEKAIKFVKDTFQKHLVRNFGFERVSAPLFLMSGTGVNDNLRGVERPVEFDVSALGGAKAEIVHSLAKWKRLALKRYGFRSGEGIYTDMNAICRDGKCDNMHSVYVDQWDWDMVISRGQRNVDFLKMAVMRVVAAIVETLAETKAHFPLIDLTLKKEVTFVTSQEALDIYPSLDAHERDRALAKEYGTVFLMNIGGALSDGKPHDGRAPDYDDWTLNGDVIFYDEVLDDSIWVASMGVRVDGESLKRQLEIAGTTDRLEYEYHRQVIDGELPLTIGGGIGQSNMCMLLLQKAHIGEVQVGLWDEKIKTECEQNGIKLL